MKKYPAIVHLTPGWVRSLSETSAEYEPGKWGPARALPFYTLFGRWRAAWLVFMGRADALVWPGNQ